MTLILEKEINLQKRKFQGSKETMIAAEISHTIIVMTGTKAMVNMMEDMIIKSQIVTIDPVKCLFQKETENYDFFVLIILIQVSKKKKVRKILSMQFFIRIVWIGINSLDKSSHSCAIVSDYIINVDVFEDPLPWVLDEPLECVLFSF